MLKTNNKIISDISIMENKYLLFFIGLSILPKNYAQKDHQQYISNTFPTDEYQPFQDDCRKFLKIDMHNNVNIISCAPGTAFDNVHRRCDLEYKVDCSDRGNSSKMSNEDENSNIVCPTGNNGLHPYPNDCTKFIECAQGHLYKKDCASQTGFNKNLLICDPKYNLQCDWKVTVSQQTTEDETILCPKNTTGIFTFPFDSGKYINCTNGQTWVQNCALNYTFSISQGKCVASTDITYTDFVNYKVPYSNIYIYKILYSCPHDGQLSHLYPFDAAKFISCSHGQLKVVSCGPSEFFSITRQTCWPKDLVLVYDRVPFLKDWANEGADYNSDELVNEGADYNSDEGILFCSLDLFGLYPHPFNNTKYLKCVYGRLYSLACRSGYAYSLAEKMCETLPTDSLPPIQNEYKVESIIEMRSNDSLTYLSCPLGLNGIFVHPFDCHKYLTCSQGAMKIIKCSKGHIYSMRQRDCQPHEKVTGNDHVECTNGAINDFSIDDFPHGVTCSPTGVSKHPHPQDWHKYVQCDNGKISIKRCPRNHKFSLTTSQCIVATEEME